MSGKSYTIRRSLIDKDEFSRRHFFYRAGSTHFVWLQFVENGTLYRTQAQGINPSGLRDLVKTLETHIESFYKISKT